MVELKKPIAAPLGTKIPEQNPNEKNISFNGGVGGHFLVPLPIAPGGGGWLVNANLSYHLNIEEFYEIGGQVSKDTASKDSLGNSFEYWRGLLTLTKGEQKPMLNPKSGREEGMMTVAQHLAIGVGDSGGTKLLEVGKESSRTFSFKTDMGAVGIRPYFGNYCGFEIGSDRLNPTSNLSLQLGAQLNLSSFDTVTNPNPPGLSPIDVVYSFLAMGHRLGRNVCQASFQSEAAFLQKKTDPYFSDDESNAGSPSFQSTRLENVSALTAISSMSAWNEENEDLAMHLNAYGDQLIMLVVGKITLGTLAPLGFEDASNSLLTSSISSSATLIDTLIAYNGWGLGLEDRRLKNAETKKEDAFGFFWTRLGYNALLFAIGAAVQDKEHGPALLQAANRGIMASAGDPDLLKTGLADEAHSYHLFYEHHFDNDKGLWGYRGRTHLPEKNLYSDVRVAIQTPPFQDGDLPLTGLDPARENPQASAGGSVGGEIQIIPEILLSAGARAFLQFGDRGTQPGVGLEEALLFSLGNEKFRFEFGPELTQNYVDGKKLLTLNGTAGFRFAF